MSDYKNMFEELIKLEKAVDPSDMARLPPESQIMADHMMDQGAQPKHHEDPSFIQDRRNVSSRLEPEFISKLPAPTMASLNDQIVDPYTAQLVARHAGVDVNTPMETYPGYERPEIVAQNANAVTRSRMRLDAGWGGDFHGQPYTPENWKEPVRDENRFWEQVGAASHASALRGESPGDRTPILRHGKNNPGKNKTWSAEESRQIWAKSPIFKKTDSSERTRQADLANARKPGVQPWVREPAAEKEVDSTGGHSSHSPDVREYAKYKDKKFWEDVDKNEFQKMDEYWSKMEKAVDPSDVSRLPPDSQVMWDHMTDQGAKPVHHRMYSLGNEAQNPAAYVPDLDFPSLWRKLDALWTHGTSKRGPRGVYYPESREGLNPSHDPPEDAVTQATADTFAALNDNKAKWSKAAHAGGKSPSLWSGSPLDPQYAPYDTSLLDPNVVGGTEAPESEFWQDTANGPSLPAPQGPAWDKTKAKGVWDDIKTGFGKLEELWSKNSKK
jgi:hypothetical protein